MLKPTYEVEEFIEKCVCCRKDEKKLAFPLKWKMCLFKLIHHQRPEAKMKLNTCTIELQ